MAKRKDIRVTLSGVSAQQFDTLKRSEEIRHYIRLKDSEFASKIIKSRLDSEFRAPDIPKDEYVSIFMSTAKRLELRKCKDKMEIKTGKSFSEEEFILALIEYGIASI